MPEGESPPMDEILGAAEAAPSLPPSDHSGESLTETSAPQPTVPDHTSIANETEITPHQDEPDTHPVQEEPSVSLSEILGEERKEVSQERQQKEINRIGATVINQEITKRRNAIDRKELLPDDFDASDRAFLTIEKIQNQNDGVFRTAIDLRADDELNQPDITITYKNRPAVILELTSRNGEIYGGRIRHTDFISSGEFDADDISQSEVTRGLLKAQGDILVDSISDEAAQEATKMYVDSVVANTPVEHSEANDFIIAQAADERGMLNIEDVISFLQIKDKAALSEEEKAVIQQLKDKASTTNILLDDELEGILHDIGFEDSKGALADYTLSVSLGEFDQATSRSFKEAFRSGDQEALKALVVGENEEEIAARRNELAKKIAVGGIIGLGAILLLMRQVVSAETKEFKKSLR